MLNVGDWIQRERGDGMSEQVQEFMSEHWVILYGLTMFLLGKIAGYFMGKRG